MPTNYTDTNGIEVQTSGSGSVWGMVAHAQCDRDHGGNRGLALNRGAFYECQGCLAIYTADTIRAAIARRRPSSRTGGVAYRA